MISADVEVLVAVHRLVDQVVRQVHERHGALRAIGCAAWWSAPDEAKLANLLILAEAYLVTDPHQIAAEQLKEVATAISAELQRERDLVKRRSETIANAQRTGDSARTIELTAHHASDQWSQEIG